MALSLQNCACGYTAEAAFHSAKAFSVLPEAPIFLGIDIGTGGTRAVIVSHVGEVVASHSADHAPISSPLPGWAEQHPEDWWRAAQMAIRAASAAGNKFGASPQTLPALNQLQETPA